MTIPPVSLGELRAEINTPAANRADDEELWRSLLAATNTVESRCGAMEPHEVTSSVATTDGRLLLPEWPVMSVATIDGVAVDPNRVSPGGLVWGTYCSYSSYVLPVRRTVVYQVGRDPVPDALRQATLIIGAQLWESQRGPVGTAPVQFTGVNAASMGPPRGFALPNRALELMEPYMFSPVG